jgi:hypothetical protein
MEGHMSVDTLFALWNMRTAWEKFKKVSQAYRRESEAKKGRASREAFMREIEGMVQNERI